MTNNNNNKKIPQFFAVGGCLVKGFRTLGNYNISFGTKKKLFIKHFIKLASY